MEISKRPDLSKVLSWERLSTSKFEETEDRECAEDYYVRAKSYLEAYDWCQDIRESYVGIFYSKILAVFLFKIQPGKDVGEWVWVIVGDLPPAILPLAAGYNPGMALDVYLGEMDRWVEAVVEGAPVDELLPVNAPPTKEYAERLRWRLNFIGEKILMAEYQDDLGYDPDEPLYRG